ncbi:hypothetical protein K0M31_019226 [Melipona bicolor]|uniref:Uncharacterized protein n=1 Tax=Melipona bicolor TaxID=60889 RepID=A0AA40G1U0_9HYME|nr:hypothetical protein K0M31_019226 [Melipona bicolor]
MRGSHDEKEEEEQEEKEKSGDGGAIWMKPWKRKVPGKQRSLRRKSDVGAKRNQSSRRRIIQQSDFSRLPARGDFPFGMQTNVHRVSARLSSSL